MAKFQKASQSMPGKPDLLPLWVKGPKALHLTENIGAPKAKIDRKETSFPFLATGIAASYVQMSCKVTP